MLPPVPGEGWLRHPLAAQLEQLKTLVSDEVATLEAHYSTLYRSMACSNTHPETPRLYELGRLYEQNDDWESRNRVIDEISQIDRQYAGDTSWIFDEFMHGRNNERKTQGLSQLG